MIFLIILFLIIVQAFLSKYVDESAVSRRRSQSEDDNPPSPVTMDSDGGSGSGNVGFLSHHRSGPQSPAQQRDGLRFHPPLTPPSGSNPHTPASPHTANISQVVFILNYIKFETKFFFLIFFRIFKIFFRQINIKVLEVVQPLLSIWLHHHHYHQIHLICYHILHQVLV